MQIRAAHSDVFRHQCSNYPVNQAPTARIAGGSRSGKAPYAASFDGRASSDGDGKIVDYAWSFGDGTTATGAGVDHIYMTPGTYTVELMVTDDDGAEDRTNVIVTVTEAENVPPVARIAGGDVSGTAPFLVNLDGRNSADPDGTRKAFFGILTMARPRPERRRSLRTLSPAHTDLV